jgi:phage/plasmid-like protein (TIGR03299 family)
MPAYFDEGQGFFVRQPSWHRLEQKVLEEWPGTWEEARVQANLLWEPEARPLYSKEIVAGVGDDGVLMTRYTEVKDYIQIVRSDTDARLTVQSSAYRVINNTELGRVIETVLGVGSTVAPLKYEGVFTLHGGKLVIALLRNEEPRRVVGDFSETLPFTAVCSRHDGNGGLKIIKTNTRVVCANTWGMAEHSGKDGKTSFTVRHTANWDERVAEIRDALLLAEDANEEYYRVAADLQAKRINGGHRERFLEKFMPIGSDMGDKQKANRYNEREQVRIILASPTCEGIDKTAYGLLQAAGEWCDHYRKFRSQDTYVTRQLVTSEPLKARAFRLTKDLAGIK